MNPPNEPPQLREERARREEELRPFVRAPFLEQFDRDFAAAFGRWPAGSPLAGSRTPQTDRRRAAVAALVEHGATEGERAAARAALSRLEQADELAELERTERDRLEQEEEIDWLESLDL